MPNQNLKQNNADLEPKGKEKCDNVKEQNDCPIKLDSLKEYWDLMKQHYTRDQKRMRMLEQVDSSDLWKTRKTAPAVKNTAVLWKMQWKICLQKIR